MAALLTCSSQPWNSKIPLSRERSRLTVKAGYGLRPHRIHIATLARRKTTFSHTGDRARLARTRIIRKRALCWFPAPTIRRLCLKSYIVGVLDLATGLCGGVTE